MNYQIIERHKMFEGDQLRLRHQSISCQSQMTFSMFIPPQAKEKAIPVVYWLSGLTCTDENFTHKAGAQKKAAELGLILVVPDTSPRGESIANDDAYDLGQGAGFYVNATELPWAEHFKMLDYIVKELPSVVNLILIDAQYHSYSKQGIFGHSMGGHGALTIGLSNPNIYDSISAFAPISNPTQCPWGQKAFTEYLGAEQALWCQYDAVELIKIAKEVDFIPVLVDQGDADQFLSDQLNYEALIAVCKRQNYPANCRLQQGYDHSYFFIASFIDEHLEFHFKILSE
jgi:S-formylglutathione hydrolase